MNNKKIKDLEKLYDNTPIPEELDLIVEKTLREGKLKMNKEKKIKRILTPLGSIAAACAITIAGVNISPSMAASLGELPVVGNVIEVLTFREYNIDKDNYDGNIVTPNVEGLKNKELQDSLNKKYIEENKQLYNEFVDEIEELEENGGGHLGVDSGYIVKTDTDEILSIARYTVNTVASSSTVMKYDTISKKNNILISLPSLFKDDKYIEIISENIKEQMIENNKKDENNIYWVEGIESEVETFEEISKEQSFYINEDNKLVISFDKYEVAPGYMGVLEFEIPTEILSDVLISDEYIR